MGQQLAGSIIPISDGVVMDANHFQNIKIIGASAISEPNKHQINTNILFKFRIY